MKNILFLGQKNSAEVCFSQLLQFHKKKIIVSAAVSNQSVQGVWWNSNQIYLDCRKHEIPFMDNTENDSHGLLNVIREREIDMILSVQHPWILHEDILKEVSFQAYNLHHAKLPDYRGCNSCNHAILNNESSYSVTIHQMAKQVDSGNILYESEFALNGSETAFDLYQKATAAGFRLFQKLIEDISDNRLPQGMMMKRGGRIYHRNSIESLRCVIDSSDKDEIERKSRAFYFPPFEPAYIQTSTGKVYLIPEQKWSKE